MLRRSRVLWTVLALAAAAAIAVGVAQATVYSLSALASGGQEIPSTPSTGSATGLFTYDDATNTITWDITYSGLLGNPTASHIHLGAPDVNGGVIIPFQVPSGGHYTGSLVISDLNETRLLTQETYLNLHTNLYPGGEIRGAVSQPTVANDESAWGAIKALFADQ